MQLIVISNGAIAIHRCRLSETAEGSIWEALDKASFYRLGNLTAIVDVNRLGQRGPTELEWDLERYAARVTAFGARPLIVDGHDLAAIDEVLTQADVLYVSALAAPLTINTMPEKTHGVLARGDPDNRRKFLRHASGR